MLIDMDLKMTYLVKYNVMVLLHLLCCLTLSGQPVNLVPNPSFEDYSICPSAASIYDLKNNCQPNFWYKPDRKEAVYYNACAVNTNTYVPFHMINPGPSYQPARTGVGYIGMFYYNGIDGRNYFQVKLTDSLRKNKCYYVECYVSLGNSWKRACNNQGILLTKQAVYVDTSASPSVYLLPANPQVVNHGNPIISDTLNWVKVSGLVVAEGGEQYLTLGNFRNNIQTASAVVNPSGGYDGAGYYVDDVSVIPLDSMPLPADAGPDVTVAPGGSVFIGSYTNGLTAISWYNNSGAVIATGVPGITVSPATSTFYVIEQTVCGNYSRDTVMVEVSTTVPLSFVDYRVSVIGEQVRHVFTTANEVNVAYYNIQRSSDGRWFTNIGREEARNVQESRYVFVDQQPLTGTSYYRIEAIHQDGNKQYSRVEKVQVNAPRKSIVVYPNPAKDVLVIESTSTGELQILDILGRVVKLQRIFAGKNSLDISVLVAGLYRVCITSPAGRIEEKLIKE